MLKQSAQTVCIVLRPCGPGLSASLYYLYFLHLKEDSPSPSPSASPLLDRRNASIRFTGSFPLGAAYVVVDSTLYTFGGVSEKQKCYSYDLSQLLSDDYNDNPGCKLDFTSMMDDKYNAAIEPIPSMASEKRTPRAVLIGGRICVFSTRFDPRNRPCHSNFELYDPVAKTWSSLPEPPINVDHGKTYHVNFFCVEDSKFFISTNRKGSFSIDFGQPFWSEQPEWAPFDFQDLEEEFDPAMEEEFVPSAWAGLKVGNLLFTPSLSVHDIGVVVGEGDATVRLPQDLRYWVEVDRQVVYSSDRAIIHLPNERLRVCFIEVGGMKWDACRFVDDPVLRVTQLEFDDDAGDGDGDDPCTNQLNPTILSSTMFYVDESINTYDMKVLGAFAL